MPKEQLRTGILLATRDVLDEVIDEIWARLSPPQMRKVQYKFVVELSSYACGVSRALKAGLDLPLVRLWVCVSLEWML